jgi:hypothetical protein
VPRARLLYVVRSNVASSAGAAADTYIPVQLKGRSRARFIAQLPQHVPAVLTTLSAGASALRSKERTVGALALAAAELLVGAWVLATIADEARHLFGAREPDPSHTAAHVPPEARQVEVSGLAAAALGYVEVWRLARVHGYLALVSPYMLGATASLALALGWRRRVRMWQRRWRAHLAVTPSGIAYRGSRLRRWTVAWPEVAAVEAAPGEIVLRLHDGRTHVLRAEDHLGGAALIAAARSAIAGHAPALVTRAPDPRAPDPTPPDAGA